MLRIVLLVRLLAAGPEVPGEGNPSPVPAPDGKVGCPSIRPKGLLGIAGRVLTLPEMVSELERGCLALDDVRFRPGQDTIESLSPAQFALVARALGLAQGAYRVTVPPEVVPGSAPDTLQARRRGTRLRDELVHYGASSDRLMEDPGWPIQPVVAAPGAAIPMLVRVQD